MSVAIRLREKDGQHEHARVTQNKRTGDVVVTVRAGLLQPEARDVMRQVLKALSVDYHPGLPEPVRRRRAAEHRREEAERVANLSPEERARHEARQKIMADMIDSLDAIESAS